MKNVIFIAPPAAGKGTLSKYLEENLGYVHISTGDLLRNVMKSGTALGNLVSSLVNEGKFVGDDVILPLFKEELLKIKDKPFILDGMPRNLDQAAYLDKLFSELGVNNYVVIHIDIDKDLLEKRAVGRRICSCGASYNVYFDGFKPQIDDVCDYCQKKLVIREDDTSEKFKVRYQTYLDATSPLIEFYQNKDKLKSVDANKSQEDIVNDMLSILKGEENDKCQKRTRD